MKLWITAESVKLDLKSLYTNHIVFYIIYLEKKVAIIKCILIGPDYLIKSMLSNRLILLRRSHVTSRLLDLHVRYNFKWDNYKNSIDIIESFGKLSKPARMSQPESIGAPTRRVNKHIVDSIKTRVFDPSSSASRQSNSKRLKTTTASQQDGTGTAGSSSIGDKKNASASPQMGIRILSNGYGTGVKSFVLVTTTGNYLVNAGEGWWFDLLQAPLTKIREKIC